MKLIIGLGNPGFRYRNTRHNIGFMAIKEISKRLGMPVRKKRHKGLIGWGSIEGEKITLFMPQTYMNLSGEAVREALKKQNAGPGDILVVYDDIDLALGVIRFREKGKSGGHKGLESIIKSLRTSEFSRIRIGIGKQPKPADVADFVLRPFNRDEKKLLKTVINSTAECVFSWITEGPDRAMGRFNKRQ